VEEEDAALYESLARARRAAQAKASSHGSSLTAVAAAATARRAEVTLLRALLTTLRVTNHHLCVCPLCLLHQAQCK
jgi:hypothetical protein